MSTRERELIPDSIIAQAKGAGIVRIVGRRVKLTKRFGLHWGLCPFHNEETPSFTVDDERKTFGYARRTRQRRQRRHPDRIR